MFRTALTATILTLLLLPSAGSAQPYNPVPGPSPYGPDDQAGASNTQGPEKVKEARKYIKRGIVVQLGHVYEEGMPQFPGTHPWVLSLKEPQFVTERQVTNGEILEGPIEIAQLGTQFDALGHFGYLPPGGTGFADVLFYNGRTGADLLPSGAPNRGLALLGIEHIKPYFTHGILLDVARYANGGRRMVAGQEVTVAMLLQTLAAQKLKPSDIHEGDAVLIRTGHEELWGAPNYYLDNFPGLGVTLAAPGLGLPAAIWLSERKIGVIGSDNWGIDVLPNFNAPAGLLAPVHHHFLAKSGIPMQESMHLKDLADAEVYEFAYIYSPMPIKGATGSPGIPLAVY
ncbi:MAG TPA: cyclase family protein [Thermoanaerobaculia bacterium]|nr:cyclase family protein [Thermoanaerobaculia bacterium]